MANFMKKIGATGNKKYYDARSPLYYGAKN